MIDKFKLGFWNEFKKIFCYWSGLRKHYEKKATPWKRYGLLSDISIKEMKKTIFDNNIKLLILDMDGTLKHYKKGLLPCNKKWVIKMKKYVKIYVVSNANKKYTSKVANELNVPYIYKAKKPSAKGFLKIINELNVSADDVIVIGDAIRGDILGSKRAGISKVILLDDINININKLQI